MRSSLRLPHQNQNLPMRKAQVIASSSRTINYFFKTKYNEKQNLHHRTTTTLTYIHRNDGFDFRTTITMTTTTCCPTESVENQFELKVFGNFKIELLKQGCYGKCVHKLSIVLTETTSCTSAERFECTGTWFLRKSRRIESGRIGPMFRITMYLCSSVGIRV